nr:MAG TPA: hypothetical protein [Caudoviricetes sp.]
MLLMRILSTTLLSNDSGTEYSYVDKESGRNEIEKRCRGFCI